MRPGLSLALVVTLGLGTACSKLRERQAIRKYAKGAARANEKLRSVRTLEANLLLVRKGGNVERVRRFFKETFLPAFTAYVQAVRQVSTDTATLRRIHSRYLTALEATAEAYASYADHVTVATLITAWKPVQRAREALAEAESRYRREIAAYYRKNDVKLASE